MSASLTSLAYLVAAVLFILALRGLSSPVTSRSGNRFGMIGMTIAVVATLLQHGMHGWGYLLILFGILIGGSIGTVVALRIQMTALPQLASSGALRRPLSAINTKRFRRCGTPKSLACMRYVRLT